MSGSEKSSGKMYGSCCEWGEALVGRLLSGKEGLSEEPIESDREKE